MTSEAADATQAAKDLAEVVKRAEEIFAARRGPRTTEFWVSLGSLLFAVCVLVTDTLAGRTDPISHAIITAASLLTAGLTAFGYSASRAKAKAADAAALSGAALGPPPAAPLAGG